MVSVDILLQLCLLAGVVHKGSTVLSSVHCAVRRELSPCTCENSNFGRKIHITVTCERLNSFAEAVTALQGKFDANVEIKLIISHSDIKDLPLFSFNKLGFTIHTLKLEHDNIYNSYLPETVFHGGLKIGIFSLCHNSLNTIPSKSLQQLNWISSLDLGHGNIQNVSSTDLQGLPLLRTVSLDNNSISLLEKECFPSTIQYLILSQNKIRNLNGTLRELHHLTWLSLSFNDLESLDQELPVREGGRNIKMMLLVADYNKLTKPPQELQHFTRLNNLSLKGNQITSLHGALSTAHNLTKLDLTNNKITMLAENDFASLGKLVELYLARNNIENLNGSLLPLKALEILNLAHNSLQEFSLREIRGLTNLDEVDLSHNCIHLLSGQMENQVEFETKVRELKLQYNRLHTLSGSLMGLSGLLKLNVSHNSIESISPDDLIDLDNLDELDISHNHLTTLEETSKTFLPWLTTLIASHNWIRTLENDFHGLPKLCKADLSFNKIEAISVHLADNTQCQFLTVNQTLRVYLQGNPVLCDANMTAVIKVLESKNKTKIHGYMECDAAISDVSSVAQLP